MLSPALKLKWILEFFGAFAFLWILSSAPPSPPHWGVAGSFLIDSRQCLGQKQSTEIINK